MATQLGDLLLSLKLDSSSFNDSLNNAKTAAMNAGRDIEATLGKTNVAVNVQVKTEALTKLNEQLGATGRQIDALQAQLDKNPLRVKLRVDGLESAKSEVKAFVREVSKDLEGASKTKLDLKPTVDFNQIHELNKLIDVKVAHVASANPKLRLRPTVDTTQIDRLSRQIDEVERKINRVATRRVRIQADDPQIKTQETSTKTVVRPEVDTTAFSKSLEKAVTEAITTSFKSANPFKKGGLSNLFTWPIDGIKSLLGNIWNGVGSQIGFSISKELADGLSDGLADEFSYLIGSFGLLGRKFGKAVAEDFIGAFGADMAGFEDLVQDIIGKKDIATEGFATRGRQSAAARERQSYAGEQARAEQKDMERKAPEIVEKQRVQAERAARIREMSSAYDAEFTKRVKDLGGGQVKDRMGDLRNQRDQLQEELFTLNKSADLDTVVQKQAEIKSVREKMSALRKDRENLVKELAEFKRIGDTESALKKEIEIASVDEEMTGLKSQRGQLQDDLFGLNKGKTNVKAISQKQIEIKTVREEMSALAKQREALQRDLNNLNAIGNKEGAIEKQIEMMSVDQQIESALKKKGRLQRDLFGLKGGDIKAILQKQADAISIDKKLEELNFQRGQLREELTFLERSGDASSVLNKQMEIMTVDEKITSFTGQKDQIERDLTDLNKAGGRPEAVAKKQLEIKSINQQIDNINKRFDDIQKRVKKALESEYKAIADLIDIQYAERRALGKDMAVAGNEDLLRIPKKVGERSGMFAAESRGVKTNKIEQIEGFYEQLVNEVAKRSGLPIPDRSQIPKLVANDKLSPTTGGSYRIGRNEIQVRPEILQAMSQGQLDDKSLEILVHELRHAMQLLYGELADTMEVAVDLIKPTAEEAKAFGGRIEASIQGNTGVSKAYSRAVEEDAYTFAARNLGGVKESLAQTQSRNRFLDVAGTGGGKMQNDVSLNILQYVKLAREQAGKMAGKVDATPELAKMISQVQEVNATFGAKIKAIPDIETLSPSEVDALVAELQVSQQEAIEKVKLITVGFLKDLVDLPQKRIEEATQKMTVMSRKKDLMPIAKNLGVESPEKLSKAALIQKIAESSEQMAMVEQVNKADEKREAALQRRREMVESAKRAVFNPNRNLVTVDMDWVQEKTEQVGQVAGAIYNSKPGQMVRGAAGAVTTAASGAYGTAKAAENLLFAGTGGVLLPAAKNVMQSVGLYGLLANSPIGGAVSGAAHALTGGGLDALFGAAGGYMQNSLSHAPGLVQWGAKPMMDASAWIAESGLKPLIEMIVTPIIAGNAAMVPVKMMAAAGEQNQQAQLSAQQEAAVKALAADLNEVKQKLQPFTAKSAQPSSAPQLEPVVVDWGQSATPMKMAAVPDVSSQIVATTAKTEFTAKPQPVKTNMKPAFDVQAEIKAAIQKKKDIEKKLNELYKQANEAIAKADEEAADRYIKQFGDFVTRGQDQLDDAMQNLRELGQNVGAGGTVQDLGRLKGRLTQKKDALAAKLSKRQELNASIDPQSELNDIISQIQSGAYQALGVNPGSKSGASMGAVDNEIAQLLESLSGMGDEAEQSLHAFEDLQVIIHELKAKLKGGTGVPEADFLSAQAKFEDADDRLKNLNKRVDDSYYVPDLADGRESIKGRLKRMYDADGGLDGLVEKGGSAVRSTISSLSQVPFIGTAVKALAGLSLLPLIQEMGTLAGAASQTALEFNNLERSLNFTAGGDGAGALSTLSDRAFALGGNFRLAAESYQQLTAATKDTALEGALTENIQKYVENAAVSFGLTAEKQQRMTAALVQIAAKGVVSQEEVRGQLAEAAPAAIGQVTRGLGLNSTSELNKRISAGMSSGQFLEALTRQGNAELGLVTDSASRSPQASFNRLGQAQTKALTGIGQGVLPIQGMGAEVAAQALNLLAEKANVVTTALTALTIYAASALYPMLARMAGLALTAAGGLTGLSKALLMVSREAATAALKFGALMLAVDLGKAVFNAFQDGGGVFREYATSIEMGNKRIAESFDLVRNAKKTGGIVGAGSDVDNLKGSMFADTAIGSIVGKENTEALEKAAVKADWMDWLPVIGSARLAAKDKNRREGSGFRLTSQAEKLANDRVLAINDAMSAANESLSTGYTMLGADGKGTGEMRQVIELDKRIKEIQSQRRGISATNPLNKAALDALKEQEKMLQSQREKVAAPVEAQSAQLSKIVEGHKKALSDLDKSFEGGGLTQQQYAAKTAEVKAQLAAAQKQQELFNKAMGGGVTAFDRFADAWSRITDRIADANTALRDNAALLKTEAAKGELSGSYTQGQAESMRNAADQQASASQLANLKTQIAQKQAELDSIDSDKVLKTYSVEPTDGASRLKTLSEKATDPREKAVLEKSAELRELQSQAKESEAALYESFANTNRQLKEATRSVDEFARGISRQSQELALAAKENRAEVGLVNARMKLKQAMQGFHQTFIDQFMGQVIEILQTSTEQTKIMIDAQRQVMGIQNTLQDQLLQAQQQANTLPGMGAMGAMNQPGGFVGGGKSFNSGLFTGAAGSIGVGAAYHIDTKFERSLGWDKIGQLFDQIAAGYEAQGRFIEFSNAAVSGLTYKLNDPNRLQTLKAAIGAHASQARDEARGVYSVDYYAPKQGGNRFDSSVEGHEIVLPTVQGGKVEYAQDPGGYGNFATILDSRGNVVLRTGHGDVNKGLPGSKSFGDMQPQQQLARASMPSGRGFSFQQLTAMMEGGSNSQIAKIVGMAEGNRTADGGFTKHAYGHIDPGNGKHNIGSFSAQGALNDGTIAGSDQRVIEQLLRPNINKLFSAAHSNSVAITPKLLLNYIDLLNQAPEAATGWSNGLGMLGNIASIRGRENDDEALKTLRAEGFRNKQGRLETTFSSLDDLRYDQGRRMGELNSAISAFGLSGGGKGAVMAPTTGMTQGSLQNFENLANTGNALQAKLAESSAQARQNAEQQAAQVLELANARAKELGVDNDGKVKAAISTLRTGNKESNATVRQTERDIEDRLDAIGYQTPEKQFNRERRQIERRQSDTGRSVTEELDRTKEAYEKAVKGRSAILESGLPKEIQAPLLVELDKSITTLKTNQDKLSKSLSESDRVAKLELDDAQRKRVETERLNALQAKVTLAEKAQANAQEEAANLRIAGKPDQAAELERSTTIGLLTERFNLDAFNLKKQSNEGMITPEDYEIAFTKLQEGLKLAVNNANRTKERAVDERLLARDQNLGGLRQEQAQNQIVQFRRDGDPFKALALDEQTQRNMQSISLRQQLAEQKQLRDQGKLTADEFDRAVGLLAQINDMKLTGIKQQFEDARRAAEFAQDKERFQSRVNLTNARSQSFKNYGLDSLAADYDKETAMAGANMDYKTERNRIDNAEKGGEITAETANKLRYELNELNKVTLDNITQQFNPLTQAITGAKDAFGTAFADLLEGAKSVDDIFKELRGNLGRMLAQMAGKRLSEELFGMILGKGKNKSESESKEAYQGLGLGGQAGDFQGQLFASGEQFGRIVISSGEQFKAILTGSQYTPMSTTGGSIPFAPLSMNPLAGGLSNDAFSNLGDYNIFSNTYTETPGSLLDTVEGDSILGGGLVSASNTAVENLKNGVGEASITFAASGGQAAQGLQVGIQGLMGSIDKFSKGDVGGGILGIAGTVLSLFSGGIFGGKPKVMAKGNLDLLDGVMPKVFASGNLGALDGIMSAMQQERAMSGYNPMLAVVNDKEAILSAEQTKRFYALGLDKQVRGFAAGNLGSGSRAGDSINVNIPVSVSGGDNRVNWDQAQSELGPQIQTMFATWVNQQRRDGGMFSG